ncbi:beta strand repeat-containing protein [Agromyces sp. GXS1127]|uniref:beta strand repeat-containing protein n=1 Tax=Agromyces sp. GXS1127 TaxID=3424181 RepID=UPI003D31E65C
MSAVPARADRTRVDEEHRRRRIRVPGPGLVFAAIVALVVGFGAPSVAVASHVETQLTGVCAQKSNGLARVAAGPGDCRPKQETFVAIWPGPTELCIQPDGSVRSFSSAKACTRMKPPGEIVTVPSSTPMTFCAPASGVLRRVDAATACGPGETRYVIGNHDPSDIVLDGDDVLENEPAGTDVGTFSITDADPAATPTFSLVAGPGDDDNASFAISGDVLETAAEFDFEAKTTYSIRVRATDGYGGSIEEAFTIDVLDVDEDVPPTAIDDTATVAEDTSASAIDVLANDVDPDAGPISIDQVTQPSNGTVVIAAGAAYLTYAPDADYCTDPPGTTTDDFTYTLAPGGSTATVAMTVTCVDDAPTAVDDTATVAEDSGATALDVLANDTDVDGAFAIASATDPANGTVALTGGAPGAHTGLTYEPDADFCNDPPGTTTDDFTYTLAPGGATATVSVTVICVDDGPLAGDDTFTGADSAIGNTAFVIDDPTDGPPSVAGPHVLVTGSLLANDGDPDSAGELAIVAGTFATEDGGTVTLEADGDAVFRPAAGRSCTDTLDAFEYTVIGAADPGGPSDVGRVIIQVAGCVWYVSNAADGNAGTSTAPFDTLAQAGAATPNGDAIFVFEGDGTTTGYDTGIGLDGGQQLIGEAADLVVLGRSLHDGVPSDRPMLTATENLDAISISSGNHIAGLTLDPGVGGGGISGGGSSHEIHDVRIIDTGTKGDDPGIDLVRTTGTVELYDLIILNDAIGIALDEVGHALFDGPGLVSVHSRGAPALVAELSDLDGSRFDQLIAEDSAAGGIRLAATTGAVTIGGLDLDTTGTVPAFLLDFSGPVTVEAAGTADITAAGGPAVHVLGSSGSTLAFDSVSSTSPTYGVSLSSFGTGTFSASGGTLTSGGAAFDIAGGSGDIGYGGTIGDGAGTLSARVQDRTGGTVTVSGPITDGPDAGGGILLTGNTGGATVFSGATKTLSTETASAIRFELSDGHALSLTGGGLDVDTTAGSGVTASASGSIAITGAGNTIDTTTGAAITVLATDIASDGMTLQRVSSDGAPFGIGLNATGTAGRLMVTGLGSTAQGGDHSGGTIQNTVGAGISFANTVNPSFRNVRVLNAGASGVAGAGVAGFSFTYGTISGAGDAVGEDAIAFDGVGGDNLTGAVDISGNVITEPFTDGITIANAGGTIGSATISGNRIEKDALATDGAALRLAAKGSASGAATLTKATVSSNVLHGFAAGTGIVITGGNEAGPAKATLGTPNSPMNVIAVTGNRMDGGNGGLNGQPEAFTTVQVFGVADGNVDVSSNGTTTEPLRHLDCMAIETTVAGTATVSTRITNNVIDAGSRSGCPGIGQTATTLNGIGPTLRGSILNNDVRATGGPGISVESAGNASDVTVQVSANTVAAPTGSGFAGIDLTSGGMAGDAALCVAVTINQATGSSGPFGVVPGIVLRKIGTDPNVNSFGIQGLAPSPAASPTVENYVNSQNPTATGTFLSSATSGFTSCTAVA